MSEEGNEGEGNNEEGVIVDGEGKQVDVENLTNEDFDPNEEAPEVKYPDDLPDRLKTGEDWQEKLIKSYNELDAKMKGKGDAAPDEYQVPEELGLPEDDEVVDGFAKLAREKLGLSNEKFVEVMEFAKESGLFDEGPSYEEELGKLGSEGKEILGRVANYASKALSKEETATLEGMVFSAEEARVIDKIIMGSNPTMVPVKPGDGQKNKADLQKELGTLLNDPEIRTNPLKKKEAEDLAKRIAEGS